MRRGVQLEALRTSVLERLKPPERLGSYDRDGTFIEAKTKAVRMWGLRGEQTDVRP
jgi:hypothetical protein